MEMVCSSWVSGLGLQVEDERRFLATCCNLLAFSFFLGLFPRRRQNETSVGMHLCGFLG